MLKQNFSPKGESESGEPIDSDSESSSEEQVDGASIISDSTDGSISH